MSKPGTRWVGRVYFTQAPPTERHQPDVYPAIARILDETVLRGCLLVNCQPPYSYEHDDLLILRSGAVVIRTGVQGHIFASSKRVVQRVLKKMQLPAEKIEKVPLDQPLQIVCHTHERGGEK